MLTETIGKIDAVVEVYCELRTSTRRITMYLSTPRRSTRQRLFATLGLGLATLLAGTLLFGIAVYANVVPPFDERISLSPTRSLEVGVVPGCPPAMPEIACLH